MKKDVNDEDEDLGPDADEETEGGESAEGDVSKTEETTDPVQEKPEAEEDEDGFVSSKDMFDEM